LRSFFCFLVSSCYISSVMAVLPKDAAAVILLRDRSDVKFFWVKRSPELAFMGGFHAFPGGQFDDEDASIKVSGYEHQEAAMRACAARELFEETGVLLAGDDLLPGRLAEMRRQLRAGKSFRSLLKEEGLEIAGHSMIAAGRWVTPQFAPRRFNTWFFLAWLPEGQEPIIETGELEMGQWVRPRQALELWQSGQIIMAPPTLHIVKTLAECPDIDRAQVALTSIPEASGGPVRRIEFKPGIFLFPVRTPTLPPATHTNCYIIGGRELVIIDPASPYEEEQKALDDFLQTLIAEGCRVRQILLTHHHSDHVGGVNHLREQLNVPVAAHRLTAERLAGRVRVDCLIEDGELIDLGICRLRALHTPGHARGHLCFYEEVGGSIISGDLVVGIGTVIIDPPEGNMRQYMNSLRRLLDLPKLTSLFGAHGPPIGSARHKIEQYIEHRAMREAKILEAVRSGAGTIAEIVPIAYADISPSLYHLAERSTLAHLEKLQDEGLVRFRGGQYREFSAGDSDP
jgi:glyoxylase-like metal-dependent hydrolase (beta-lactamase superfamily II)/8-oxo-dGTP pyrophosphatase MutT (NUDIX family)